VFFCGNSAYRKLQQHTDSVNPAGQLKVQSMVLSEASSQKGICSLL
jgi:hypothetical protein